MIEPPRRTQQVMTLLGTINSLPPAPRSYLELAELAAKPGVNLAALARVVESDPGLTVSVLHLVNSALFGRAQKTSSIQQAIGRLGIDALKALVVSANLFSVGRTASRFSVDAFQAYSMRVARHARDFVSPGRRDDAFTAGLVHDIGKLILAVVMPEGFSSTLEPVGQPEFILERERLGVDHAEVGACLLATWRLPQSIVEIVRYHHQPSLAAGVGDEVCAAVHAADALAGMMGGETSAHLDLDYLEAAGVRDQLPRWREIVARG